MTTLREAAQQALEALDAYSWEQVDAARTALRAALAEPVREPVAVALHTGTKQGIKWYCELEHGTKLYTHPRAQQKPKFVRNIDGVPCITLAEHEHLMRSRPQAREWVGLTDDEFEDIEMGCSSTPFGKIEAMKQVEAKLKEKNSITGEKE